MVVALPQTSVAVQTLVYVVEQLSEETLSIKVMFRLLQSSIASGSSNITVSAHSPVLSSGTLVNCGAVVSTCVTVADAVEAFPQPSEIVQVRTVFIMQPEVSTTSEKTVAVVLQLSVAVGDANVGAVPQSIVTSAGTPAITGAVVSVAVMVWEAEELLPQASVASHTRVQVITQPSSTVSTLASVTSLQLSVNCGSPNTGVSSQEIAPSAGTKVNSGASTSTAVICCMAVTVNPQSSVAVQTLVQIISQLSPAELSTKVMLGTEQLSTAVARPNTSESVQAMVNGAGTKSNIGAVVSKQVMVCVAIETLPQSSVTYQVRVTFLSQPFRTSLSIKLKSSSSSQLSVASGATNAADAAQSTVKSCGKLLNSGICVSISSITMVKEV